MTITLENVESLLEHELKKRKTDLDEIKQEIEELENELRKKKDYVVKLTFYIDKFSKVVSIVEMSKQSSKSFEEVHKNIPQKTDRE